MHYSVDRFYPNPMRCFNCQRFGHTKQRCTNKQACYKCGDIHTHVECTAVSNKCLNCKGQHEATSKDCPHFIREKSIIKIKIDNKVSFARARLIYNSQYSQKLKGNSDHANMHSKEKNPIPSTSKHNSPQNIEIKEAIHKDSMLLTIVDFWK